jgi:hypothetical protein
MNKPNCDKCNVLITWGLNNKHFGYFNKYITCEDCVIKLENLLKIEKEITIDNFFQPERSKREDATNCRWNERFKEKCNSKNKYAMRCSEHCGNTVSEAQ